MISLSYILTIAIGTALFIITVRMLPEDWDAKAWLTKQWKKYNKR